MANGNPGLGHTARFLQAAAKGEMALQTVTSMVRQRGRSHDQAAGRGAFPSQHAGLACPKRCADWAAALEPSTPTGALNVSHGLHDESSIDAHEVHTAHGIALAFTPAESPANGRSIAGNYYVLQVE